MFSFNNNNWNNSGNSNCGRGVAVVKPAVRSVASYRWFMRWNEVERKAPDFNIVLSEGKILRNFSSIAILLKKHNSFQIGKIKKKDILQVKNESDISFFIYLKNSNRNKIDQYFFYHKKISIQKLKEKLEKEKNKKLNYNNSRKLK